MKYRIYIKAKKRFADGRDNIFLDEGGNIVEMFPCDKSVFYETKHSDNYRIDLGIEIDHCFFNTPTVYGNDVIIFDRYPDKYFHVMISDENLDVWLEETKEDDKWGCCTGYGDIKQDKLLAELFNGKYRTYKTFEDFMCRRCKQYRKGCKTYNTKDNT